MPVPRGFHRVKKLGFDSKKCAKGSLRFTTPNNHTKILACCREGQYNKKAKKCSEGLKSVEEFKR